MLDYYGLMPQPKRLHLIPLLAALWGVCAPQAWSQGGAPVNSELSSALFYEILVGELSAQNDDAGAAYALLLDAAQKANSPELFERSIDIALRARAGDSALLAAQAWATAFPASKDANRYLLQILVGLNKLSETVEPIRRLIAPLPPQERITAIGLMPRYFARAADKRLAASVVEQSLVGELTSPITGPAAWATVGTLRLMASDTSGALDAAQKGNALGPKATEPVLLALALMGPGAAGAEGVVTRYLELDGAAADVRMGYVRRLIDAQRYLEASAQTQRLTTSEPGYAEAWLVRGSLEFQDKKLDEANNSLRRYLQLGTAAGQDRGLVQAHFLLSQIAESKGDLDGALQLLAPVTSPQDVVRVQTRRATLLAKQGKLTEARALIRGLPESQPEDVRTKINAEVQILREAKQYQASYDVLQSALKDYPQDADLTYELAMAAEKVGRLDEMEKLLRSVIAAKPDYHHAYNALGYSLADRKLRLDEARQLVKKALEFAPDDPFIVDSLGWVEFRSGNADEARRLLQTAFQNRPDAEIAAHLGEVLWSLRQTAQAKDVWSQGMRLNPNNETLLETIQRLSKP
jgi:tetratricopeptide (TPR) repeat protein